jgi:hypothetical protein
MMLLGNELPQEAFELLNRGITTAVISTVDEDGFPRTAPFHWIVAKDKKTLRVGVIPKHKTYENMLRDGKVMVCVIDEGNISLGIKGIAKVIKDRMESTSRLTSIAEIKIDEVKSDALPTVPILHGIRFQHTHESQETSRKVFEELKRFLY